MCIQNPFYIYIQSDVLLYSNPEKKKDITLRYANCSYYMNYSTTGEVCHILLMYHLYIMYVHAQWVITDAGHDSTANAFHTTMVSTKETYQSAPTPISALYLNQTGPVQKTAHRLGTNGLDYFHE